MQIGQPNLNVGKNFDKNPFHKLEPNKDNLFRLLPPVFSLASLGQWFKYYATHTVYTKEGGRKKFICIQDVDRKTKLIKRRCPYCDRLQEATQYRDALKANGATKEQLDEFRLSVIGPFELEKRNYLNAIDAAGVISLLAIPYKLCKSIQTLAKEYEAKTGINVVAVNGMYLNLRKNQAFKGDKETEYTASIAQESVVINGKTYNQDKAHELTPEIINMMETKASDLGTLFKELKTEEIAALANAQGEQYSALVESFFSKPEPIKQESNPFETTIPGTTSVTIARVENTPTGPAVVAPTMPTVRPSIPAIPTQQMQTSTISVDEDDIPENFTYTPPAVTKPLMPMTPVLPKVAMPSMPQVSAPIGVPNINPVPKTTVVVSDDDFIRNFQINRKKV